MREEAAVRSVYLCIDLKSFFASVECVERGLDPMTARLVVADPARSSGTICLAVSPEMKRLGVRNRCRVYEIPKEVEYIMAEPRMQKYLDYSAAINRIYERYIAPEDLHVYSIDEVFIDATPYLARYKTDAHGLAVFLMERVAAETGIRATCGIGENLFLAKVALDITAKHARDFIGELDEERYRATLWDHEPLTDFWYIGPATARRLARVGIRTMRGIAQMDERWLYREFGVAAKVLIEHARGHEPTTLAEIKSYRPRTRSLSSGQVLLRDYSFAEARIIVREMTDRLCLDMVEQEVVTPSVTLTVGYSGIGSALSAHGTAALPFPANADCVLLPAVTEVYDRIVSRSLPIRRITLACNNLSPDNGDLPEQLSLFAQNPLSAAVARNRRLQHTVLQIHARFGRNALLKGMDFDPAATTRERNHQIGGHKSGT